MDPASTAILIFAQSASRDAAAKNLPGGERIFDHLTGQAIQKARQTGLPWFHFDERTQVGRTFGERLSRAMETLFERGFESLVVIGNDSPDLRVSTLKEAAWAVARKKAVLGPSGDGGVYLIGMHRSHFDAEEFRNLPWRGGALFQGMMSWLGNRGAKTPLVLDYKMDLDTLQDCRNWTGSPVLAGNPTKKLLMGLTGPNGPAPETRPGTDAPGYFAIPCNKGSPASRRMAV